MRNSGTLGSILLSPKLVPKMLLKFLIGHMPSSSEDSKNLFIEKQKFMYAVFERTLQTDQGKAFVRQHEKDFDAQKIYMHLEDYSIKSTKASLDTSKLLSYITSAKIGDGTWKGTAQNFILHWSDKVRLYEKQIDVAQHFTDTLKRVMLQNAVHPIEELRAVKIQADQHKTQSGVELTYEQYVRLLTSAASNYNGQFVPKARHAAPTLTRRTVYTHDITDKYDDSAIEAIDGEYDIDIGIDTIQANSTNQHTPGSRMPFTRWKSLPPETQAI
jgi:hypothetical protein